MKIVPRYSILLIIQLTFPEFFTNQTGLTYTLKSVWQESNQGATNIASSITYHNNQIRNCSINTVQIDFTAEDSTAAQYGWRRWGENVLVYTFPLWL